MRARLAEAPAAAAAVARGGIPPREGAATGARQHAFRSASAGFLPASPGAMQERWETGRFDFWRASRGALGTVTRRRCMPPLGSRSDP